MSALLDAIREQLDAEIAKTTKAEESRNSVVQLYAQLYNSFLSSTGTKPSYPRDPLSQPSVNSLQAEFAPETIKTRVVRIDSDNEESVALRLVEKVISPCELPPPFVT